MADKCCIDCGRTAPVLRRDMCQRCYMAQYNGRQPGLECECCGQSDPRLLTRRRLDGETWFTLCGNCFVLSGKRLLTLEALRLELHPAGDRRGQERRSSRFTRRYSARREPFERRWIATDAREGETRRASGERRGG